MSLLLLFASGAGAGAGPTAGLTINAALIEVQLSSNTWTNLTPDVIVANGIQWEYGLDGSGPRDCLAGAGSLRFQLRNGPTNSGSTLGWYSPVHGSRRTGWTYGIPVRLILTTGAAASVSSITRLGSTASVTTSGAHGLASGDYALIVGAAEAEYNGLWAVTVTGGSTFDYTVSGTPSSPATGTIQWIRGYVKFRGKVWEIRPSAGAELVPIVDVVAYDQMRDLYDSNAREVALAVDQDEATLIGAVLDAIPFAAQPSARSLDPGVDTFPYAFDDVGRGATAAALLKDVLQSSYGIGFCRGDGTFVYLNRHTRGTSASLATFANTMREIEVPSSLDGVYNHVVATIHPKTIDATADTVLYAQAGQPPLIGAGATMVFWGDYRDPDQVTRLIGGLDAVAPQPVTDYLANVEADGSGYDMTDALAVSATAFASTAKFTITNTAGFPIYLTKCQLRGRGIYDDGPQSFEAETAQAYGDRVVDVDLPYQDNHFIGQSAATYIEAQYRSIEDQVESLLLPASANETLLTQAITREPGDVITVAETVTGVNTDVVIHRCAYDLQPGNVLWCRWGLAPASPYQQWWELGNAGNSELTDTTRLGF